MADEFPAELLPKINLHSAMVKMRCNGKLLQQQLNALKSLTDFFTDGLEPHQNVAVVAMPTGSGKTGVMCCLPYFLGYVGLQGGHPHRPTGNPRYRFDKPILVIAPDLAIANQLEQQMLVARNDQQQRTFLIKRGIVPMDAQARVLPTGVKIETASDLDNALYIEGKELIIANAQKFLGEGWRTALRDDMFQLVIVDEAHHHPAKTWRDIVEKFRDHALVVFFTATPYRADRQPILDPTLYPNTIAYHLTLQVAIDARIIRQTAELEELSGTDPLEGIQLNMPNDRAGEMGRIAVILRKVAEIQTAKDENKPLPGGVPHMAMAIAKNIGLADNIVELWNIFYPNKPAAVYHSELPKHQLEAVMNALLNNRLKLVVVVAMLLEGFDHPPISIAAVTHKIVSPVKFVQFVGRAQRIYRSPEGNEEDGIADIITHVHYEQRQNYDQFVNEELIPV